MKGLDRRHLPIAFVLVASVLAAILGGVLARDDWFEKRVRVVVPGRLVRGAWQRPGPLRRLIDREGIRTIVTLTAINASDPKFRDQAEVVRDARVRWLIVPMRGSRGTPEQMAQAADLLADPSCQPVFFHCVAGHHRTSLAHAAYLVRHQGYSAEQAWSVISSLPWTRPESPVDQTDRFLIEEFARVQSSLRQVPGHDVWEISDGAGAVSGGQVGIPAGRGCAGGQPAVGGLEPGDAQLRRDPAAKALPLRPDDTGGATSHHS